MKNVMLLMLASLVLGFLATSCTDTEASKGPKETYEGPWMVANDVNTLWSDSSVVQIRIEAATLFELKNGDQKFPDGLFVRFFDLAGEVVSTMRADSGFYDKEKDRFQAMGNVLLVQLEDSSKVETEEMFWEPNTEEVHTEKFVTITDKKKGSVLTGEGMRAKQDFSEYEIIGAQGQQGGATDSGDNGAQEDDFFEDEEEDDFFGDG